jgi:hypothetical protein
MTRPKLKLTLLAALTLASCSQVLGIDDYDIDDKLDRGVGGNGNQAGQGNAGGSDGGSDNQAGAPDNQAGAPSTGGQPSGGSGNTGGSAVGGTDPGGAGGDGGGPPLGQLIPCDSLDCCDAADGVVVGTELLGDGGFELAAEDASLWLQESIEGVEAITDDLELGWKPRSGDVYTYLSGIPGERTSVYSEDLVIPDDAGWLTVSGYRRFQIDEMDETNEDFALVAFFSYENDSAEETPFWWGNPSTYPDDWGNTLNWVKFERSWDAAPYQGLTTYLGLRGESDLYPADPDPEDDVPGDASSYLFDDVSLEVFRCYEEP